jgi:hypothetical protein
MATRDQYDTLVIFATWTQNWYLGRPTSLSLPIPFGPRYSKCSVVGGDGETKEKSIADFN